MFGGTSTGNASKSAQGKPGSKVSDELGNFSGNGGSDDALGSFGTGYTMPAQQYGMIPGFGQQGQQGHQQQLRSFSTQWQPQQGQQGPPNVQ